MPIKEHNFSQQELDIILSQADSPYTFNEIGGDYIRLTVFNNFNQIVNTFESKELDNFKIYQTGNDIYVKPNEILFENQIL